METSYRRYITIMICTLLVLGSAVLSVNMLVDPLWFLKGNQLTERNYVYNERYGKANHFLKAPDKYDCVILGSSTTTFLRQDKVDGYTCFNFAFSGGTVAEFYHYLQFVRRHVKDVKLVIVGVDWFNFVRSRFADETPPYIRNADGAPPTLLGSYLALDPFFFSLRTLAGRANMRRYYTRDFAVEITPSSHTYVPATKVTKAFQRKWHHDVNEKFNVQRLDAYKRLREVFPAARFVGYVPPVDAHYIGFLRLAKTLDGYLDANYRASRIFDQFYDFSMPSAITREPTNTYDGQHFMLPINDRILERINGKPDSFGLPVHTITWPAYRNRYLRAADRFLENTNISFNARASAG